MDLIPSERTHGATDHGNLFLGFGFAKTPAI